jgi:hypothetical protein
MRFEKAVKEVNQALVIRFCEIIVHYIREYTIFSWLFFQLLLIVGGLWYVGISIVPDTVEN